MLRRLSPLVLLIALLIAAEPLLHNHPLESSASARSSSSACVICATGVGQLPTVAVVAAAPQIVEHIYVCAIAPAIAADAPLPRSPRAPPAA
jgi:hypothetical protein